MFELRELVDVLKFDAIFIVQKLMPSSFESDDYNMEIRAIPRSFDCYAFEAIYKSNILTSQRLKWYFISRFAQNSFETFAISRFQKAAVTSII
jgi:hypothetical protein